MVITASPVGSLPIFATIFLHSSNIAGPPALWIAPSTPPPPIRLEFAAFTIASTLRVVISATIVLIMVLFFFISIVSSLTRIRC